MELEVGIFPWAQTYTPIFFENPSRTMTLFLKSTHIIYTGIGEKGGGGSTPQGENLAQNAKNAQNSGFQGILLHQIDKIFPAQSAGEEKSFVPGPTGPRRGVQTPPGGPGPPRLPLSF